MVQFSQFKKFQFEMNPNEIDSKKTWYSKKSSSFLQFRFPNEFCGQLFGTEKGLGMHFKKSPTCAKSFSELLEQKSTLDNNMKQQNLTMIQNLSTQFESS